MKKTVGYVYTLSGDIDFDLKDYEEFCLEEQLEPYDGEDVDSDSLKEYLINNFNLVEVANDGELSWVEEIK